MITFLLLFCIYYYTIKVIKSIEGDLLSIATPEEVNNCLMLIKEKLSSKKGYTFIPRPKNMEALTNAGLTIPQAIEIVKNLTYKDYFNGPTDDRNYPNTGDMWEFGCNPIYGDFYIKIKISYIDGDPIIILSFHDPVRPIRYPYRD